MKEKTIYEIIKRLVENKGNKKRAAIRLGCTERYVNKPGFRQKVDSF